MSPSRRGRQVREPIQVYLTKTERAKLDRLARELGISGRRRCAAVSMRWPTAGANPSTTRSTA
jgi:hypothetical protein